MFRETDDEIVAAETLADLEEEFGEMRWPMPKLPIFHQSLSSDAEFGYVRMTLIGPGRSDTHRIGTGDP